MFTMLKNVMLTSVLAGCLLVGAAQADNNCYYNISQQAVTIHNQADQLRDLLRDGYRPSGEFRTMMFRTTQIKLTTGRLDRRARRQCPRFDWQGKSVKLEQLVCELADSANVAKINNARGCDRCCLECIAEVDAMIAAMNYNVAMLKSSVAVLCGNVAPVQTMMVPMDVAPGYPAGEQEYLFPPSDEPAMIQTPNLNPPQTQDPSTILEIVPQNSSAPTPADAAPPAEIPPPPGPATQPEPTPAEPTPLPDPEKPDSNDSGLQSVLLPPERRVDEKVIR